LQLHLNILLEKEITYIKKILLYIITEYLCP